MKGGPECSADVQLLVRSIIQRTDGDVRLALPLGLGKPNTIVNALTNAAIADQSIKLKIFTALSLAAPTPTSDLQKRLLLPAMDRLFGRYPKLVYLDRQRDGQLPSNIQVSEFFLQAGVWRDVALVQQHYISANYTHALDVILAQQPNVLGQLLATNTQHQLSLSCNTDISVDLLAARARGDADFLVAGEINPQLPFMGGAAICTLKPTDLVLEDKASEFELFSAVKRPVSLADHAIGLRVSQLIADGGTLQIGIGSIGDAVANALLLRQQQNEAYQTLMQAALNPLPQQAQHVELFNDGLYAATEMLVDGLLQLFLQGVVKREVDGVAIHAGFFLESRSFYQTLRELSAAQLDKIGMMPVSFTNDLYGDELAKRAARVDARFVNNAMMTTLLGAVVSDGTADGKVVSGVGGQYNFVAQAFALKGARSIITVNATRQHQGCVASNIIYNYGHQTIPRHLRDLVVTEYGVADLRGQTDEATIIAMLSISDHRFQEELMEQAKQAGKLASDYQMPDSFSRNTPESIAHWLAPYTKGSDAQLPTFPFGTDFTAIEQRLLPALDELQNASHSKRALARLAMVGLRAGPPTKEHQDCLQRLQLDKPDTIAERISAALVRGSLVHTG